MVMSAGNGNEKFGVLRFQNKEYQMTSNYKLYI